MMAVETCVASDATVRSAGTPEVVPNRVRVTPGIAPVIVLLALSMGTPSTVAEASAPVTAWVNPNPVVEPAVVLGSLMLN